MAFSASESDGDGDMPQAVRIAKASGAGPIKVRASPLGGDDSPPPARRQKQTSPNYPNYSPKRPIKVRVGGSGSGGEGSQHGRSVTEVSTPPPAAENETKGFLVSDSDSDREQQPAPVAQPSKTRGASAPRKRPRGPRKHHGSKPEDEPPRSPEQIAEMDYEDERLAKRKSQVELEKMALRESEEAAREAGRLEREARARAEAAKHEAKAIKKAAKEAKRAERDACKQAETEAAEARERTEQEAADAQARADREATTAAAAAEEATHQQEKERRRQALQAQRDAAAREREEADAKREAEKEAARAERERQKDADRVDREARRQAEREEREARKAADRAARAEQQAEDEAKKQADAAARQAQREADREADSVAKAELERQRAEDEAEHLRSEAEFIAEEARQRAEDERQHTDDMEREKAKDEADRLRSEAEFIAEEARQRAEDERQQAEDEAREKAEDEAERLRSEAEFIAEEARQRAKDERQQAEDDELQRRRNDGDDEQAKGTVTPEDATGPSKLPSSAFGGPTAFSGLSGAVGNAPAKPRRISVEVCVDAPPESATGLGADDGVGGTDAVIESREAAAADSDVAASTDGDSNVNHVHRGAEDYCRHCGERAELSMCSKCMSVGYCSVKCQAGDWKRHKKLCKSLRKEIKMIEEENLKAAKAAILSSAASDNSGPAQSSAWRDLDEPIPAAADPLAGMVPVGKRKGSKGTAGVPPEATRIDPFARPPKRKLSKSERKRKANSTQSFTTPAADTDADAEDTGVARTRVEVADGEDGEDGSSDGMTSVPAGPAVPGIAQQVQARPKMASKGVIKNDVDFSEFKTKGVQSKSIFSSVFGESSSEKKKREVDNANAAAAAAKAIMAAVDNDGDSKPGAEGDAEFDAVEGAVRDAITVGPGAGLVAAEVPADPVKKSGQIVQVTVEEQAAAQAEQAAARAKRLAVAGKPVKSILDAEGANDVSAYWDYVADQKAVNESLSEITYARSGHNVGQAYLGGGGGGSGGPQSRSTPMPDESDSDDDAADVSLFGAVGKSRSSTAKLSFRKIGGDDSTTDAFANATNAAGESWDFRHAPKAFALAQLVNKRIGTFVVRQSDKGFAALSLVGPDGEIVTQHIDQLQDGSGDVKLSISDKVFPSLPAMIKHYASKAQLDLPCSLVDESGRNSRKFAELEDRPETDIPTIGSGTASNLGFANLKDPLEKQKFNITLSDAGRRVHVQGVGVGTLAYFGPVEFADKATGEWCGVHLDAPNGKNSGSVQNVQYFDCPDSHGIFVSQRSRRVKLIDGDGNASGAWGSSDPRPAPSSAKGGGAPRKIAVLPESNLPDSSDESDDGYTLGIDKESSWLGGPVLGRGPDGETPDIPAGKRYANALHEAANRGDVAELKSLIRRRAYPLDSEDHEGRSPLMHAVHRKHVNCALALIKAGADVDFAANDGSTPLHESCYNSTMAMTILLLNSKANPRSRDQDGRQPIHWSTDNPFGPKCMLLLIQQIGIDIDSLDDAGMTPLMWAACHDQAPMVNALIDLGSEPLEKDMDGKTAMDWAIRKESISALKVLLDLPSTFFKDMLGRTVMHTAAERGSILAVEYIMSIREDAIHDLDKKRRTPLFWAAACDERSVVLTLLAHGCDIHARDNSGLSALDYARAKGYQDCVEALEMHQYKLERAGLQLLQEKTGIQAPVDSILRGRTGNGLADPAADTEELARLTRSIDQGNISVLSAAMQSGGPDPQSNLKKMASMSSESMVSLYTDSGQGKLASANGGSDQVAYMVPSKLIIVAQRFLKVAGGIPAITFTDAEAMSAEGCFESLLHPRGFGLLKTGNEGRGKSVTRFFRVAIDGPKAFLIWSRTQDDLAKYMSIMSAGLLGVEDAPDDTSGSGKHRLIVNTSVKTLYLQAGTAQQKRGWLKGLNHLFAREERRGEQYAL